MRLLLSILILLLIVHGSAAAQTDVIGLFVDTNYEECNLVDAGPGVVSVYVVHSTTGGANASQFVVQAGSGVALSYVGEVSAFPTTIGNTQSGISIGYTNCQYSEVLVATISYYTTGGSSRCSNLYVAPDPASLTGTIEVVNCSGTKLQGAGSRLVINPNGSCDCGPTTQDSNWGKIKDIYD
jgi:hypothetical protein